MNLIGTPNVYFPLPSVKATLVKPPGEERTYFASIQSENEDTVLAAFPQCPLQGDAFQNLEPVEIAKNWLQEPETQLPRPLDTGAHPEIRETFQKFLDQGMAYYPGMTPSNWEAVGEATDQYNCIANSMGRKDTWMFPSFEKGPYLQMYQNEGYLPLESMDYRFQPGLEKVVLYGVGPSDPGYWDMVKGAISAHMGNTDRSLLITHAARQESDGVYTSKFGAQELVATASPEDVAGEAYGRPLVVLARQRP